MLATHKAQHDKFSSVGSVLMLSAWGFTMVIASFLFLYVGHLIDSVFGTAPNFMLGLFFLGLFLCIMRLYQEACKRGKDI
jgi:F0F1-type ATP synthase assembly protein I